MGAGRSNLCASETIILFGEKVGNFVPPDCALFAINPARLNIIPPVEEREYHKLFYEMPVP